MANSLNQAFIRAYAKERETANSRAAVNQAEAKAAEKQAVDDLIQRFDTATVQVPSPHLHTKQSVRERVAVTSGATKTAANRTARPQPVQPLVTHQFDEPEAHDQQTANDDLRTRIANSMLRAGDFQSEQIASLNSFIKFPNAPQSAAVAQPNAKAAELEAVGHDFSSAPASTPLNYNSVEPSEPTEPAIQHRDIQAQPTVQASASKLPTPGPLTPTSTPSVEPAATVLNKSGTILRVDNPGNQGSLPVARPSTESVVEPTEPMASSTYYSEPASSVRFERPAAEQSRRGAATAREIEHHAEQVAEAMQVERKLRKAKVRIFNPVWEVDQLQWPAVCLQLMEAKTESLSHVAKHLIDACQEGLQVLAVTSPEGGEGRTTVACCLARLAGSRGLKTAIVDGDVENPTLCIQTNLEIEKDWQSALLNQVPLEEIAVHSIDDQITLLPLLGPVDQEELPVDDQRIADMLTELSESFDLVIVDMGHMSSPNGLLISLAEQGVVNAAIAVVDHRSTTTQRIETCIRRIRQAGVSSIGLVENFAA